MKLLTPAASNPKTAKGENLPYEAAILHLAPANLSGYNTCPFASGDLANKIGCVYSCLNQAGRGQMTSVQRARIRKTRYLFEHETEFMRDLVKDIEALERRAARRGKTAAVRLNGTSDIIWQAKPCRRNGLDYVNVFAAFPDVVFYDYTKVPSHISQAARRPSNYSLTFSLSESNDVHAIAALKAGLNLAVVFKLAKDQPMPLSWAGCRVIDGTEHDFRFLDPQATGEAGQGIIVGLRAKGRRALQDTSGFVREPSKTLDPTRKIVLAVNTAKTACAA